MLFKDAIIKFGNSKGIRFEKAAKDYQTYILKFADFIKKPLSKVDNDDIVDFQMWMRTRYADTTRALYASAIREFFKFTNGRGWTRVNKDEISVNKIQKKIPVYVAQGEAQTLCDITEGEPVKRLAVKILWLCGPRITELATLKKENVDLISKGATIRNLKHHDEESTKFIVWDDETNALIKEVMAANDSEWVFYSKQSKTHLTPRQFQRWFVEFREKAGMNKKMTPHSMRHGFVKENLDINTPLPHLQQMGGWQSLEAMQKYTKRLTNDIKDIASEALRKRVALAQQKELAKQLDLERILREV